MGLIQKFKERSNKTAKTSDLSGGIHKNINLVDFSEDIELKGDYKRYLFMKFKQIDAEGNPLGEFSTSFMELDPTSNYLDFKVKLLLKQTHNLAVAMYGDEWKDNYDPLAGLIKDEKEAHHTNFEKLLNKRAFVKELEKQVKEKTGEFIEKFMEKSADKKFILKIVYNDKGYVGLPSDNFIQDQTDTKLRLSLSDKEKSLIKKYKKGK
jgi:hypothetical protein